MYIILVYHLIGIQDFLQNMFCFVDHKPNNEHIFDICFLDIQPICCLLKVLMNIQTLFPLGHPDF